MISSRAFGSLWYWVVVALVWGRAMHTPMGMPSDIYDRARRLAGDGAGDTYALLRAAVARQLAVTGKAAPWLVGLWAFVLTVLAGLGLVYGIELAQALLFLAAPLALCQWLSVRTALDMAAMEQELPALLARMGGLRGQIVVVGMVSIFATAIYGMIFDLRHAMF